MKIALHGEEPQVLSEALESYLSDLHDEIAQTDSHDFREGLKHRRAVLERAVEALRERAS